MLETAVMAYPVLITSVVTALTLWRAALLETAILSALTISAQLEEQYALVVPLFVIRALELVENVLLANVQLLVLTVVPLVMLIYLTTPMMEPHALLHKFVKMHFV